MIYIYHIYRERERNGNADGSRRFNHQTPRLLMHFGAWLIEDRRTVLERQAEYYILYHYIIIITLLV